MMTWPSKKRHKAVPFKCSKCNKERRLFYVNGVQQVKDARCLHCGGELVEAYGRYGTKNMMKSPACRAVG